MNIRTIAYRTGIALALAAALGGLGAFAVRASADNIVSSVSVSIDANGQTGSHTLAQGQNLVLSWSSQSAAFCSIGAPISSQVSTQGSDVFAPGHPFYPQSGPVTYTVTCDDGFGVTASDSVTVSPYVAPVQATVDITANASQGPVVLNPDQSFTVDWISANVVSCGLAIQGVTDLGGVALNGTTQVITPAHPFYPPAGGSHTFVITCADVAQGTVTDSVTIMRAATPAPAAPAITATTGTQCGGTIDLAWNAVPNAASYKIFRGATQVATVTGTTYADSGLTPGQSFAYTVRASNSAGDSAPSNSATATASAACAPTTPTVDITANASQGPVVLNPDQSFTVDWISANVVSCGLAIQGVTDLGGVALNGTTGVIVPASPLYPAAGGSHTFVITCTGIAGETITDSVVVSRAGIIPEAPILSARSGLQCGGRISLTWDAVSGADSYKIFRDGILLASTNDVSYEDIGLVPGQSFTYAVRALNQFGESVDSNTASATASAACVIIPQAPAITATTGTQCGGTIDLAWNAVPNAASYKIFRGATQVATVTGTTYADSGLTPGQSFAYTVRASNSAGDSAPSNSATATASAACAPTTPTVDITANASQGPVVLNPDQSFTVDWISANVVSCGLAIQGVTDLGGVALNGTTGVIVPASPLYPAAGGSHTFVITCTGIAGETITDSVVVSRPTLPPAIPSVTAVTSTQCGGYVDVSWNAVSGATVYRVFRDGVLATSTTATNFNDSGLALQTFYVYTVKAVNGAGESAFSNPASARASGVCVTKPEAPVLTATTGAQCGGTIALSWNAVPQATEYTVQRGSTVVATVTGTTFTDSGLQTGVSYTYSVTASNSAGDSAPSNPATATASAACTTPPQTPLLTAVTGAQCGGTIDLAWNAVSGSSYYIVFRGDSEIATTSATTFTDAGLTKDAEFKYRVKAVNAEGASAFSNKASAVSSGACTPLPSVVLEAVPSTINQGQISTLSWISNNSVSCSAPWTTSTATSGSELVGPRVTTTYSITCTGPGGSSSATATVTVIPVNECSVPVITSPLTASGTIGSAFSYTATVSNNADTAAQIAITGALPAGLTVEGATISGTPLETGTFSVVIAASNSCGTDTETLVITIGNGGGGGGGSISVTLTAQPTTIVRGATSTLSWISSGATECSAAWTTATSTAGSILVSPATTTSYAITCTNGSRGANATATVTVIDAPQCVAPNITSELAVSAKVGTDFSYTITAENQSTSTLAFSIATSSLPAGLSFSGATITGTPVEAGTYTVQVTALNACGTDTENLVITVAPRDTVPPGGGGGGGSSRPPSGRRSTPASAGEVLGVTSCNYLEDFLRIDWQNDTIEVLKLQIFLKEMEGFTDLPITGVFDQKTFDAVAIFQERYADDILTPWGHTSHTGFVYILTKKKVNEIVCQREFPLTGLEEQEIIDFRAFLSSLVAHGIGASAGAVAGAQDDKGQNKGQETGKGTDGQKGQEMSDSCQLYRTMCADDMGILNENGLDFASSEDPNQYGEIASGVSDTNTDARAIAAAIFTGPQGWKESWNALFGFFVILAAVYVASRAITEKQHTRRPMNEQSRRARHLVWFTVGLLAAVGLCLIIGFYSIILPLLVLMILVAGMAIYALVARKEERALIELR